MTLSIDIPKRNPRIIMSYGRQEYRRGDEHRKHYGGVLIPEGADKGVYVAAYFEQIQVFQNAVALVQASSEKGRVVEGEVEVVLKIGAQLGLEGVEGLVGFFRWHAKEITTWHEKK